MSDQRFDKLIKQNLDSVRPPYRPTAWDRFNRRLPAVGIWPWARQYGGWAMCGVMLAGWMATLWMLRENQQLVEELRPALTKQVVPTENKDRNPLSKELAYRDQANRKVLYTDTVYIVRKTIVEHRHFYEPKINQNTPEAKNNTVNPDTSENTLLSKLSPDNQPDPLKNNVSLAVEKRQNETEKTDVNENSLVDLNTKKDAVTPSAQLKTDTSENRMSRDEVLAILDSNGIEQADKYKLLIALADSIFAKQQPAPIQKYKRPPFRLSSLQPRFGMESLLSLHSYGIGPVIEFFPAENLGVSFGIQASTLEATNHQALRDYNSATGKLFLVQYRNYLPYKFDRIEDISINTSVVSVPVSLKYYIPLKKHLSVFVQSGTTLDISAYQTVDFESYLNKSKRRNTFETDAKPNFFHNFMFGAGVQYKRSRVLAQLSPYFVYDFRNIENTAAGSNMGLRASLWLNLYK